jgi:F-type H+-transporting ATPase subunit b
VQLDWLTVAAQIVNFLVLVWLLQRFLYRPITTAMQRREERIAARLSEARETREAAEAEARRLERRHAELDAQRDEILEAARAEAKDLRGRLEAGIREEMEARRSQWRDHLAEERAALVAALRKQAGHKVLRVTERILADYARSGTAEQVAATFVRKLEELDPDTRARLAQAAAAHKEAARVQTGTALDAAGRDRIARALRDTLATEIDVDYREDPEMVLGVRLTIGDHAVEWSATRYLDRLEAEFGEIIDSELRGMTRGGAGDGARGGAGGGARGGAGGRATA